jgi:hypothetical protein
MILEMKKRKSAYEPGVWNADTVLLGGLGNDPEPDTENDPILKLRKNIEEAKSKTRKINLFKTDLEEADEE